MFEITYFFSENSEVTSFYTTEKAYVILFKKTRLYTTLIDLLSGKKYRTKNVLSASKICAKMPERPGEQIRITFPYRKFQ